MAAIKIVKPNLFSIVILAVLLLTIPNDGVSEIYINNFTGSSACPTNGNTPNMASNSIGTPVTRSTVTYSALANVFNSKTINATSSISIASYI